MKSCETFDHTADVGLRAEADSLAELMEALAEGMMDVICDRSVVRPAERREAAVESEDVEVLALDFLRKVLFIFEVDHYLTAEVRVAEATEHRVRAELLGERYDPARHDLKTEVKAVTYHLLRVARQDGRWTGQVILDL